MATTMAGAGEDDEAWLYGEGKAGSVIKTEEEPTATKEEKNNEPLPPGTNEDKQTLSADAAPFEPKENESGELPDDGEPGERKESADNTDDEDDDDDDDDDVQITIGEIKTGTAYDAQRNLVQKGYQRNATSTPTGKPGQAGGKVDLESAGNINGVPVFEFDIDSLNAEDKPWRKPGADITDYFNYGFNEDSWKQYCDRQRRLRVENNVKQIYPGAGTGSMNVSGTAAANKSLDSSISSITTTTSPGGKNIRNAGPPPSRKLAGTIDVIGSTARDSRRPRVGEEMETAEFKKPMMTTPTPDFSMPPPSHSTLIGPPMGVPPPDFAPPTRVPPPGVPPPHISGPPPGVPPPGPVMSGPPPGYRPPDAYDAYYPPPGGPPPDRPPPGPYGAPPFGGGYGGGPPPGWDGRGPPPGPGGYGPGPGPGPAPWDTDSDISSSDDERERRRFTEQRDRDRDRIDRTRDSSSRGRDFHRRERSRSRDRERSRRGRDRDRDRGRDRDRERDRDRDRERSRRRHDEDRERSKHKHTSSSSSRSKGSSTKRAEREEESMDTSGVSEGNTAAE